MRLLLSIVAFLSLAVPAAAQTYGAADVVGAWEADFVRTFAAVEMTEEQRALAGSAHMMIALGADGTIVIEGSMVGDGRVETGNWRVLSAHERTVVIEAAMDRADPQVAPEVTELTLVFDGRDRCDMRASGDDEVVSFDRVSTAAAGVDARSDTGAAASIAPQEHAPSGSGAAPEVAPETAEVMIPQGIAELLLNDPMWSELNCDIFSLGMAETRSVDVNRDGAMDYIVRHPCNFGANDGQLDLYLADGDGFRRVLSYYGEVLDPAAEWVAGFHEMVGGGCDGLLDCNTTYFRWSGEAYEPYRVEHGPAGDGPAE